jgi:hypothetical protein
MHDNSVGARRAVEHGSGCHRRRNLFARAPNRETRFGAQERNGQKLNGANGKAEIGNGPAGLRRVGAGGRVNCRRGRREGQSECWRHLPGVNAVSGGSETDGEPYLHTDCLGNIQHPTPNTELRTSNFLAAQSHPKARDKPGGWEGIGRGKPGTCVGHAWYMRQESHQKAKAEG